MINELKKEQCTGCKMCGDICPVNAIYYSTDEEGFWYPKIDMKKCIHCNKCSDFCPELNSKNKIESVNVVYAAWIKNDKIRLKSTSGGIFYAFASYILKEQGAVVGCIYDKGYKSAYHFISEKEQDLKLMVGSKYFQSNTEGIYNKILKTLKLGKKVLFCGTPCQCAAVSNFVGKDYENLYLIEFICLGVNSPTVFSGFLAELEKKYKSSIKYVQLKNKKTGWTSLATRILFSNGKEYHADKTNDMWIKGFVHEKLFLRPSCYQCTHKGNKRSADITISDFWGIRNVSEEDMFKGISAIIINSTKGGDLFDGIKQNLHFEKRDIREVLKGNPAYNKSAEYSSKREVFYNNYKTYGFKKAVDKASGNNQLKIKLNPLSVARICCKYSEDLVDSIMQKHKFKIEIPTKFNIKTFFEQVDVIQFIYLNYLCKNVERKDEAYIIPYKNTIIDMEPTAKIILNKGIVEIGANKLKKSKAETSVKISKCAKWIINGSVEMNYNTHLKILDNALLENSNLVLNSGNVIVCCKHIKIGNCVMMGRNNIIYDSDHHQILDRCGGVMNSSKEVIIDDHVWITNNVNVFKGVHIGAGSVIGAYTVITKDIQENTMVAGNANARVIKENISWNRKETR